MSDRTTTSQPTDQPTDQQIAAWAAEHGTTEQHVRSTWQRVVDAGHATQRNDAAFWIGELIAQDRFSS